VSWSQRFAEPIVLEDGVKLASLRQAIAHLVKTVPADERGSPTVLTAAEMSQETAIVMPPARAAPSIAA
jgi:hypothetical protein